MAIPKIHLKLLKVFPKGQYLLGPLLFCMYINNLTDVLVHCKVHMYAVDVQPYISTPKENIDCCLDYIDRDLEYASILSSLKSSIIISRTDRPFVIPELSIRSNKIDFIKSATNLDIVFNDVVSRIYGMLRNLFTTVTDSTHFVISMQLARTYLIPVLLYECEIFVNCDCNDNRKLNLAFNNIAKYVFQKRLCDYISQLAYQILSIKFDNPLKIKCLIFLHKTVYTEQSKYLFSRIKFARSYRGKNIIIQQ